jgi:hypothetical protein
MVFIARERFGSAECGKDAIGEVAYDNKSAQQQNVEKNKRAIF